MKLIKYIFAFMIVVVGLYTIMDITYARNIKKFIKSNTGIVVSKCKKIVDKDNHGGFPADGETLIEYDCSKADIELNMENLKSLPLSENLNLIMYGGKKDGRTYGFELASKNGIPKIENGYYYFFDDYGEYYKDIDDYTSDEKLFARSSYNFTLIMFDSNTKHLYYYEFDT